MVSDWSSLASRTAGAVMASGLAEPVVYEPTGQTIRGVFEETSRIVDLESGREMTVRDPWLSIDPTDLDADPVVGAQWSIRGRKYQITEPPEPDGEGEVRLHLELVSP